jgi:fermentation-respiration switch protein FrsA (DUF1100 family)
MSRLAHLDIEFAAPDGVTLRGALYVPDRPGRHPAITMAHGYGAVKGMALVRLAAVFAEAGFAVLVHDHRRFGASDGTPRQDIDPWKQIADCRRAITYLESRAEVDADRAQDAVDFYLQELPEGTRWDNTVTVRSTRNARMYEPGVFIDRISPTPLLMVVGDQDTVTLTETRLAAYNRALEPKQLVTIPGGHFAPYTTEFARASAAATAYFRSQLAPSGE